MRTGRLQPLLLVFGIVLVSRLPFLSPGFGHDADGWRVACAAIQIAESGEYSASRFPGSPLTEFGGALLHLLFDLNKYPWLSSLTTALMSALAAALVFRLTGVLRGRAPVVTALAFAAVPAVYIASCTPIDYVWGTALLLGAWLALLRGRTGLAGVLLGLAIGCRLSHAVLLLPLLAFAWWQKGRAKAGTFAGSAAIVAAMAYLPALSSHGLGFLTVSPTPYPDLPTAIARATLRFAGLLGCLGLIVGGALHLFTRERATRGAEIRPEPAAAANLVAAGIIVVTALLYLLLPDDAGYLMPAAPFLLLSCASRMSSKAHLVLCAFLLISPFLLHVDRDGIRAAGPILQDHQRRVAQSAYTEAVLAWRDTASTGNDLVIAGAWLPKLQCPEVGYTGSGAEFRSEITDSLAQVAVAQGRALYYLAGVRDGLLRARGFDLEAAGGRLLRISTSDVR